MTTRLKNSVIDQIHGLRGTYSIHLGFYLCFLLSCNQSPAPSVPGANPIASQPDTLPTPRFLQPKHEYATSRSIMEKQRQALKQSYALGTVTLDSVGQVFTQYFLTEIIPHWFGTHWTFSGHTEVPRQGDIACGYFVSTTLLHAGLNLNRYRLAQQSPVNEALMLSLGDTVRATQRDNALKVLAVWRSKLHDGLYFIGLGDGHVGFLLKQQGEFYFLHANYAAPVGVLLQPVEESVLMGFQDFYLADITFNRRLMEHWLSKSKIPLQTNLSGIVRW